MTIQEAVGSERLVIKVANSGTRGARTQRILENVILYVVAVSVALGLAAVLIVVATDAAPWDVFHAMYEGSLSRPSAIGVTLDRAMPILIVALGGIIAIRAAMVNIGVEGQLIVGGMFGAVVALKLGLPVGANLPLTLLASAVGGGLWAGVAALLRFWRGVDVVISTLLLNFVAVELLSFMLNKPWLLQETRDNVQRSPQSDRLDGVYQITRIGAPPGFSASSGIFLALLLAGLVMFALTRTQWGFRLKMLGMNPSAARVAGVSMAAVGGGALVLSGALAGLAGGVIFTGTAFRVQPGFTANVGNDGLLVALIVRGNVAAAVPMSLLFGAMRSGGGFLASTGVPRYLVDVVQPLLVVAALLPPGVMFVRDRRRALRIARNEAGGHDRPSVIGAPA